jgi:acyl dehydratase
MFETTLSEIPGLVGMTLGPSDWQEMTQAQVDTFAGLTNDFNFIHVDPERAARTPFGGTIAHGFLSLALIAPVTQSLVVTDATTSINYGLEKVRFPAPLPVGARWRAAAVVLETEEIKGGMQIKVAAKVEVEGSERPAVAAEVLFRYYA